MAAAVLESVAIPRPSPGYQRASPSPRAALASSISTVSNAQGVGSLPVFQGLRTGSRPVKAASAARRSRAVRRGVVSEVRETSLEVPDVKTDSWQSSVLESDIPVLVDFWAPWCGPCRMIFPIIVELSREYAGKLKCVKLDTDTSPDIAGQYGIRSIPTIMIFKNGEKKDTIIGAVPKSTLTASIEKFL